VHRADNLTTSTSWNPQALSRTVMALLYLFTHRTVTKAAICFSHNLKNLFFVTKSTTSINSSAFTFYYKKRIEPDDMLSLKAHLLNFNSGKLTHKV
jgi:hypothetical protein